MPEPIEPVALVKEINAAIESMKTDQKQINAELKTSVEKTGKDSTDALAKANEVAEKLASTAQSILDMEQKLAENVNKGTAAVETLGQMVIKSDAFKQYASGATTRMRVEANTIIGQEGSPPVNSDTLVAPQRLPGIIPGAFRPLRLRDVIPSGQTTSNMLEYSRELAFTNRAAETAEGVTKPESDLTFELASAPVRTIAHWIKASKQVLEDAAALRSYIDTRMRYGIEYRIDNQLLNGDGVGQNISGLLDAGNFTAYTAVTGDNALDSLNRAKYLAYAADYPPDVIIMNPADWGAIERLKVGTSDATYIIGNPQSPIGAVLWGLPVVITNAMPQGTFWIGAMQIAAQVWNRMGTVVEMFEQDDVNVQKNLVTIRAEARLALAIYRPASAFKGSLTL